jgi:hypothetical protein
MNATSTLPINRSLLTRLVGIVFLAQIVFVPKVYEVHTAFGNNSENLGYVFLLSDPRKTNSEMIQGSMFKGMADSSTHIAWGQLVLQLVVTGVIGAAALRFAEPD